MKKKLVENDKKEREINQAIVPIVKEVKDSRADIRISDEKISVELSGVVTVEILTAIIEALKC